MDRRDDDEIVIRPAQAGDASAIGALWEKLVAYHEALNADLPRAAVGGALLYSRNIRQRLEDPSTEVFVAAKGDTLVGYVLGVCVDIVPEMFDQEASGFLADIFVEESVRGQGVGRRLVTALAEWFQAAGVRHFEWHVAVDNENGLAFWKSLGGRDLMLRMRADIPLPAPESNSETDDKTND
jgi:GNAT superfamily N-acetyltransferase